VDKKEIVAANDTPPEPKPPRNRSRRSRSRKKPDRPSTKNRRSAEEGPGEEAGREKETKAEPKRTRSRRRKRVLMASKMAALIDKRDPTRQARLATRSIELVVWDIDRPGAEADDELGCALQAPSDSAGMCRPAARRGGIEILVYFELRKDGTVSSPRAALACCRPPVTSGPAIAESAIRAIQQCQPYTFCRRPSMSAVGIVSTSTFSSKGFVPVKGPFDHEQAARRQPRTEFLIQFTRRQTLASAPASRSRPHFRMEPLAQTRLQVDSGNIQPIPIAIPNS